jgi:EpsI family protein
VLLAHHAGEEFAQGFLHGFAGMVVFVSAFVMLLAWDWAISRNMGARHTARGAAPDAVAATDSPHSTVASRISAPFIAIFAAMAVTAVAAPALRPVPSATTPDLEALIPASFGGWRLDASDLPVAPSPDVQANLDRLYRQIVSRTYVNDAGERVMLLVAYGGDQSDALKAHRQENCYAAQGFQIRSLAHGGFSAAGRDIPVTRMFAVRGERMEPVTYWFTMGDRVVLGRAERLRTQLENGLAGRIPDGLLVRVSTLSGDAPRAYAVHQSFVAAWMAALAPADATRFVGAAPRT